MADIIHAAIDIGTVTCRLFVARVHEGVLEPLHREVAITNLGIGVDATGMLDPEAIDRVVKQVAHYRQIIDETSEREGMPVGITAMATSASRDASNSDVLVGRLRELGIELSVIEGEREAALSFAGASSGFIGEKLMVVDIGGGSTEVIFGRGGGEPRFVHSFNIGCRRVTERFLHSDPPSQEELDAARAWIAESMAPIFNEAEQYVEGLERIVAVAGTATSVVSIDKKMVVYDSDEVDGTVVERSTLDGVYELLRSRPLEERKQVVGLEPDRASVIVAGMVILQTVLDLARQPRFTVGESDILQGIILDSAN